jgi:peroxiredoxin
MHYLKGIWLLLAVVCCPLLGYAQVTTGQAAPDFKLTDTKGQVHSLSDFKGKHVVLEWFNHDCPFVVKHYESGNMQSLQKEYTGKGVVWLSINSSAPGKQGHYTPEESNKMTQDKGVSSTAVLLDSDGKVGKMYGAKTTPHMYVIDPQGVLIYQGAIDSTPSTDPADIPASKNYVKAALDASLSGGVVREATTKSYGCSVKY